MDESPLSTPSGPLPGASQTRPARRRILGIDPGSRTTGYAVIDSDGNQSTRVVSGCIRVGHESWPGRLGLIFGEVALLVKGYAPQEMAVEQLIFARDPVAALKLGQARGAILCAALQGGLQVHEYSPKSVKQAVVGTGAAEKSQVQHMVRDSARPGCRAQRGRGRRPGACPVSRPFPRYPGAPPRRRVLARLAAKAMRAAP